MSRCALPPHLQERKHNDWPWPLSYLPRAINAKGPRCPKGTAGYMDWPPVLEEGENVTRWESTGAASIIEIPELAGRWRGASVYGRHFTAIERNPGHTLFNKEFRVLLRDKVVYVNVNGQVVPPDDQFIYSPSAVQKFSKKGWLKLSPAYYAQWDRDDYFFRWGWRPDHLDVYYNWGPYLGRNYE